MFQFEEWEVGIGLEVRFRCVGVTFESNLEVNFGKSSLRVKDGRSVHHPWIPWNYYWTGTRIFAAASLI